jgi:hypothetical protein
MNELREVKKGNNDGTRSKKRERMMVGVSYEV